MSKAELKRQAAEKAVEYVQSGMVVGLGTGSTAVFIMVAIERLLAKFTTAIHASARNRSYAGFIC